MFARLHPVVAAFLFLAGTSKAVEIFDVTDYGAVANDETNSTEAFRNAWVEACKFDGKAEVLIPEGKFLVGRLKFRGPCNRSTALRMKGVVLASTDIDFFDEDWLSFQYVDDLLITGGGKFYGRGALAWPYNQCHKQSTCQMPVTLSFSHVTNSTVEQISSVDSKQFHMKIYECDRMKLWNLNLSAPGDSPNTDGIHVAYSSEVEIADSVIGTGDDCISIGDRSRNISIHGVFCGPGHGISVGSLGNSVIEGDVVGLNVTNCTLTGTMNGIRIKTWQSSPIATYATNFVFDDIVMNNVSNPIHIDQEYCPHNKCNPESPSRVKISNIKFARIRGESRTKIAVKLLCSREVPCENIKLRDINLMYNGSEGEGATASCAYANGESIGFVVPPPCF